MTEVPARQPPPWVPTKLFGEVMESLRPLRPAKFSTPERRTQHALAHRNEAYHGGASEPRTTRGAVEKGRFPLKELGNDPYLCAGNFDASIRY